MNVEMNVSVANLYSLFKHIGTNDKLVNYTETEHYFSIQTKSSAWPNAVFNFNDHFLEGESELQNISLSIQNKSLPPLCMVYGNNTNASLLKKYGFYTIEQWELMSFHFNENNSFETNVIENYSFGLVKNESDLNDWIDAVRNSLFHGKLLDKNIFSFLTSTDNDLIFIRKNNETVGATMIYYDKNETAGIYMVCINKELRGQGLGKELLTFTLKQIQKRKISKIVLQSTKAGLALYLKAGFIVSGICNLIYKIK